MQAVLNFPNVSPELFSITIAGFEFALRWYALAYIFGLLIAWRMVLIFIRKPEKWPNEKPPFTPELLEAFLTWAIVGVVIGGRVGYVFFYNPQDFLRDPLEILKVWQGGMSFHGGFAGVAIAGLLFSLRYKLPILSAADAIAMATPPALLLGRLANFINAELWGRPTDMPWGVIFPGFYAQDCPDVVGECARHPSQLYEAGLEGVILGVAVLIFARGTAFLRPGLITGVFIAGYGMARIIVELFRQPDAQFTSDTNPIGYAFQFGEFGLTMGQALSLPMVLVGLMLIILSRRSA